MASQAMASGSSGGKAGPRGPFTRNTLGLKMKNPVIRAGSAAAAGDFAFGQVAGVPDGQHRDARTHRRPDSRLHRPSGSGTVFRRRVPACDPVSPVPDRPGPGDPHRQSAPFAPIASARRLAGGQTRPRATKIPLLRANRCLSAARLPLVSRHSN